MRGSHPFVSEEIALAKDLWHVASTYFRGSKITDKNAQMGQFGLFFGLQLVTTELVKPSFYPIRNCWRVRVPASESETGKRFAKYFETQEAAQDFIAEHRKTGSIQLAELSIEEKHVLGLIRQSQYYAPKLLLDVWRAYLARQQAQANPSLTIAELCKAFYDRQIKEG